MASTDAKSGFRLPWSSDRNESDDRGETPAGETAVVDPAEASAGTQVQAASETASPGAAEAAEDAATPASEATPVPASEAVPSVTPEPTPAVAETASEPAAVASEPAVEPARKPNKFMAELTRAMQAAAEAARTDTLEKFAADAKAHIEGIHASTADESTALRKRADDDIAAIRDWSKAEIARIREEADERVSHRKEKLEREIEAHAAEIEARIERVQARVAAFEAEMSAFFERLLAEDDPTRFAALAETLPEPPPFDAATWSAPLPEAPVATQSVERPEAAAPVPTWDDRTDAAEPAPSPEASSQPEPPAASVDTPDVAPDAASRWATAAPSTEGQDEPVAVEWSTDAGDLQSLADERVGDQPSATDAPETVTSDAVAEDAGASESQPAEESFGAAHDPRLSALGISQDLADAEAEAAAYPSDGSAETSDSDESIPVIADDALAARLAGLVPEELAPPTDSATTRVIVTGLVSVASIAGFKRNLARVSGVRSVGVSSGPDGEFVFAVVHEPGLALSDGITTLPGFGARVMNEAPGELTVAARDPETEG